MLAVKVEGAISVLFGKTQLSKKFLIFVLFLPKSQNCVNVKITFQLIANESINQAEIYKFLCTLFALVIVNLDVVYC